MHPVVCRTDAYRGLTMCQEVRGGTVSTDQQGAQGWPCSGWIPLLSLSGREGPPNPVGTLMKLKAWKGPGGVFKRERPRMVQGRKGALWPWVLIAISVAARPHLMVPCAKLGYHFGASPPRLKIPQNLWLPDFLWPVCVQWLREQGLGQTTWVPRLTLPLTTV